jgi:hypothetical protein
MTLGEFETGARVVKTTAKFCDAAYASVGTVHRKDNQVGVEWDSWQWHIVVYPPDEPGFELARG